MENNSNIVEKKQLQESVRAVAGSVRWVSSPAIKAGD